VRTARIIVTSECARKCKYCCNDPRSNPAMHTVKLLGDLEGMNEYDAFVLTGGEPLASHNTVYWTISVASRLQAKYPGRPMYLCTSVWAGGMLAMENNLHRFHGITYTLHYPFTALDRDNMHLVQGSIMRRDPNRLLNNRLVINSSIPVPQRPLVYPHVWREIREIDFVPDGNCPLGEGEDLFYYPMRGGR